MAIDEIDRNEYIGLLIRQKMLEDQRTTALAQYRYTDPSNHEISRIKIKDFERLMRDELDSWVRWGRKRDWLPTGFKCPNGFLYKSIDKDFNSMPEKILPEINMPDALRMERVVISLPDLQRRAFVMHQLGRVAKEGMIHVITRSAPNRILGLSRSVYFHQVRMACDLILRRWSQG